MESDIDYESKKTALIVTIIVILFILLGHVHPKEIQAKLKVELFTVDKFSVDWWSISHFLYFGLFGYLFPTYLGELFIIGIVWEILEDCLSAKQTTQMIDCSKKYTGIRKHFHHFSCNLMARNDDYWYGKSSDIFFNSMGLIIGFYLKMMSSNGEFAPYAK